MLSSASLSNPQLALLLRQRSFQTSGDLHCLPQLHLLLQMRALLRFMDVAGYYTPPLEQVARIGAAGREHGEKRK